MKLIMNAALFFFAATAIYAQDVTLKTEKKEYKIDETITLVFEIKAKVDSEGSLSGTNFTVIDGPKKRQSTATKDGKTIMTYTSTYRIKANSPGLMSLVSPTFYLNGQEKNAGNFTLKVKDDKLTEVEKDEINFNEFKENATKHNGALRYVVSDNFGFIEQFNGSQWEFKRRLSKEELTILIKK